MVTNLKHSLFLLHASTRIGDPIKPQKHNNTGVFVKFHFKLIRGSYYFIFRQLK